MTVGDYERKQIQRVLDAGPAKEETWFCLQVSGEIKSKTLVVSGDTLRMIQAIVAYVEEDLAVTTTDDGTWPTAPGNSRIDKLRWIVQHDQAATVEGFFVDVVTSRTLVKNHDEFIDTAEAAEMWNGLSVSTLVMVSRPAPPGVSVHYT